MDSAQSEFDQYRIHSRREIIALLHAIQKRNQLVTLLINGGTDAIVTSILEIDDAEGLVIIDQAPTELLNQRILQSKKVSFESILDSIRILFHATGISACLYDGAPALCIDLPVSLVRLQRREFYRVPTPVAAPVRCQITLFDKDTEVSSTITTVLSNISAGGMAVLDEKKTLKTSVGALFETCHLELPGSPPLALSLQIRNMQDLTYHNGRSVTRLGCMFVNPGKTAQAAIQRYITKLEREQNAKNAGSH